MQPTQLLALLALFAAPAFSLNQACHPPNGLTGVCISTSSCTGGGGKYTSGYCPNDPANVKCCTKTPCDGFGEGACDFTSSCRASGAAPIPDKCPGPSNFQCCVYP